MAQKVPVTVDAELDARLAKFVVEVANCVRPSASRALDRSSICRLAIVEMLDRYERTPGKVAKKLGFVTRSSEKQGPRHA